MRLIKINNTDGVKIYIDHIEGLTLGDIVSNNGMFFSPVEICDTMDILKPIGYYEVFDINNSIESMHAHLGEKFRIAKTLLKRHVK